MFKYRRSLSGVAVAAAVGILVSGCGMDLGLGSVGSSTKKTLLGKSGSEPEPDLPENRALVIPPPNAALPVPGQASQQNTAPAR
jgi:hypothetical protein